MPVWLIVLISLAACLAWMMAAGAVAESWRDADLRERSLDWPTAIGKVTTGGSIRWKDTDDNSNATPRVAIEYEYRVNGERFSGTRYNISNTIPRRRMANRDAGYYQGRLPGFERGAIVTVRYDPKDPSSSILQPNAESSSPASQALPSILIMAVIFSAIAGHSIRRWLRYRAWRGRGRPLE